MPINEGSSCTLVLTFKDDYGALVTPDSATYKIDDVRTETSIVGETIIPVNSSSYDLLITAAQNAILGQGNENHEVTIKFTYSGGLKTGTASYLYEIDNFRFLP